MRLKTHEWHVLFSLLVGVVIAYRIANDSTLQPIDWNKVAMAGFLGFLLVWQVIALLHTINRLLDRRPAESTASLRRLVGRLLLVFVGAGVCLWFGQLTVPLLGAVVAGAALLIGVPIMIASYIQER